MIHKDGETLMVELGCGDVEICTAHRVGVARDDELVFYQGETGEIGRDNPIDGRRTDTHPTPLRIVFHRIESIDVMIERLQRLRKGFE